MFRRILIANRGEIAVRIIRACRELDIQTVVVYSEADANSLAVQLADQAVLIGSAAPSESYLRAERIIEAARRTDCQAIHPAFGFLSENAAFAQMVRDAGLTFIGPTPEAIRAMGLKTEALARVRAFGVPTLPSYDGQGLQADFQRAADQLGYPLLVKAAAGGGGKGMRVVRTAAELPEALEAAAREAGKAFADNRLFLERFIETARHIEVQILADQHGNMVHLFERECSIQRRHQKIIEESPSPYLEKRPELRAAMCAAALRAAQSVNYTNAGTVEFIVDAETGEFFFLEMNTRLQVEHPVTEAVTDVDLVQMQIRIAAGEPLPFSQADLYQRGHAIECRIYAEDPADNFLPATGELLCVLPPSAPNIRVDSGVRTGDSISIHYDPMIAKLIAHARTRPEAIRRLDAALAAYVILGVTTNIAFLRDVLAHPDFVNGETTTRLIERAFADWRPPSAALPEAALIAAALSLLLQSDAPSASASSAESDPFSPWARPDSFRIGA
ncbi:MAG: pyruvate carboxylase subunit A [Candidatus Thermofonsia Clade 1 bacterium]|uniref:biotin carboxylase n=1 Tax=Candidatus Thermofonsia Clade 1 bacterium TaxID=2364210 RepID=A0A2M8PD71_9CHLR|nr:MAG: pyruvate carboxylase subunit A [Candidatus Thermofonsia Clade 1 bacterium]